MSKNKSPYSKTFGHGILDGYWNAFITAGTIGYGDMVVQSLPSRVVVILWITLSTIMFSMLTGTFTSVLSTLISTSSAFPAMVGNKVGVLTTGIEQDLVIQSGGIVVAMASLSELVHSVTVGDISLVLINSYAFLAQFENFSTPTQNLNANLRLQVTSQFSVNAGLLFFNSYSTAANNKQNNGALFNCLQQQSFVSQLIGDGHLNKVEDYLIAHSTPASDLTSSTSTFYLSDETQVAIALIVAIVLLVLLTLLVFNCFVYKRLSSINSNKANCASQKHSQSNQCTLTSVNLNDSITTTSDLAN